MTPVCTQLPPLPHLITMDPPVAQPPTSSRALLTSHPSPLPESLSRSHIPSLFPHLCFSSSHADPLDPPRVGRLAQHQPIYCPSFLTPTPPHPVSIPPSPIPSHERLLRMTGRPAMPHVPASSPSLPFRSAISYLDIAPRCERPLHPFSLRWLPLPVCQPTERLHARPRHCFGMLGCRSIHSASMA